VSDGALRLAVAAVAAAGIAVSAYLTWIHYHPDALVCTRGGGCETVQQSHYAVLLGAPLGLYGLVAWTAVLALVMWDSELAAALVAAIAVSALGFAAYLVILQLTVIHAVCAWCMVNDAALVPALVVLAGFRVLREIRYPSRRA
jgi:uncharacterized membrane protein